MKRYLMILPALVLAACALFPNENPQQIVFSATTTYSAALQVAVAYESLPRCGAMAPMVCSDTKAVDAIRRADTVAKTALDAAQATVRTPGFGDDVYRSAALAAVGAASAFASIVSSLKE